MTTAPDEPIDPDDPIAPDDPEPAEAPDPVHEPDGEPRFMSEGDDDTFDEVL